MTDARPYTKIDVAAAEDEIRRLNDLILEYEEAGDDEKLAPLLAEDFAIVRASGARQDRQGFLDAVPNLRARGRRASEVSIRFVADTALYTCIVTTQLPDDTSCVRRFFNTRLFVANGEKWQCLAWQVTEIREPSSQLVHVPARDAIEYGDADPVKMEGTGRIERVKDAPPCPRLRAHFVEFTAGAHTRWHRHDGEQVLYVRRGHGFVQLRGQEPVELNEGDRAFIPTGAWHRHGALPGHDFNHLAVMTGSTEWDKSAAGATSDGGNR